MYRLYYAPVTAAMAPTGALEEIGADYELVPVDISKDKPRDPEYLELNPNGWVPTLVDENGPIYEAAAIMIYLADKHPDARLAPPIGDPLRGKYLQWLVYMADTLQVAYQMHYYPERHSTDAAGIPAIEAMARERLARTWEKIDAALDPGPYMLGRRFSGCDIYVYMLTTWHPEGDGFLAGCPNVARCVDLVTARPAVRRMMKAHGLL
ncbi:MAG: glutathione S-transferase family protein [Alphaproteobacteria bacterium]